MYDLLAKVLSIYRLIQSRFRRASFLAQSRIWNGTIYLVPSVRFDHSVKFQGRGTVHIGEGVVFGYGLAGASTLPILLQPRTPKACIRIGAETSIMNGTEIIARQAIHIGKHCRIGARTVIFDSDFHGLAPDARDTPGITLPVEIGDNVWIGSDTTILKNVTIGNDAVIGARCVVTKNVPRGTIVVGNPMQIIGSVYEQ